MKELAILVALLVPFCAFSGFLLWLAKICVDHSNFMEASQQNYIAAHISEIDALIDRKAIRGFHR
jgi:hypothetical protein